jgi:hypothetical protein
MGQMKTLDETGDTKLIWDPNIKDEVDVARESFNKLKKKGYIAYSVKEGGKKGTAINEFDPSAEKIILAPAVMGG